MIKENGILTSIESLLYSGTGRVFYLS